jgi:putative sigma-54 modulation protein
VWRARNGAPRRWFGIFPAPDKETAAMQLQVRGKNVDVTEAIRAYAEEKLGRLERHLNDAAEVDLELTMEKNPSIAANHIAEVTIWTKGPTLRARESAPDVKASIDQLVDKVERQVIRYNEKRRRSSQRANGAVTDGDAIPLVPGEDEPVIVKVKQFSVNPMTPEDAVLQMELVGHDFFVFRNAESNEINVVYRRRDGNYGLIELE